MLQWEMGKRKRSDDAVARLCGKAVEKIITRLVMEPPLVITVSEADARKWGRSPGYSNHAHDDGGVCKSPAAIHTASAYRQGG